MTIYIPLYTLILIMHACMCMCMCIKCVYIGAVQMKCPVDPLKGYDNLVQKYDPPADIEFALFAKRCMQRNGHNSLPTKLILKKQHCCM